MTTSNEIGNTLHTATIKEILKNSKNREQKIMAEYLIERIPATQIFNITDVFMKSAQADDLESQDEICEWIENKTGIDLWHAQDGFAQVDHAWSPYVDDLFIYSSTEGDDKYYAGLIHRIDEARAIMFFGIYHVNSFVVFESITFEIDDVLGISIDYSHMYESVKMYIDKHTITDKKITDFLYKAIDVCFLSFFAHILSIFTKLSGEEKHDLACYVDEKVEDVRAQYFRAPSKKVTKVEEKPIILVLSKDKDIDKKVAIHRRTKGDIHYAFSWVVRGHYRKLHNPKSLGLNRNGKRCVQGMTWIEAYTKGDETRPLLKRERVVVS